MRDRTWSPRRETSTGTRRGYAYGATTEGNGFFVTTSVDPSSELGPDTILGGYLLREGEVVPVTGGLRHVERDGEQRPRRVGVEAVTADGVATTFRGDVHSRLALPTTPYFAWMSLVRWTADDGRGWWGEDHDSWSPARWRAFARAQRGGDAT
jgi:hypothetical protein